MTNPNDPAFLTEPKTFYLRQPPLDCDTSYGLTKRELIAAMAMQGCAIWDALMHEQDFSGAGKIKNMVSGAVEMADALIEELNRKEVK